jgi:uncharacterized protein (TIGR03089 family)
VLLGCAAAGVRVGDDTAADAGFATVARLGEIDRCDERFAVSLHPFALPVRDLPGGVADWVTEVRQHGDFFGAYRPMELEDEPGGAERAFGRESSAGPALSRGDRVLIDTDRNPRAATWLWAPLAAGASIVACANMNPSTVGTRVATERVTVNWAA